MCKCTNFREDFQKPPHCAFSYTWLARAEHQGRLGTVSSLFWRPWTHTKVCYYGIRQKAEHIMRTTKFCHSVNHGCWPRSDSVFVSILLSFSFFICQKHTPLCFSSSMFSLWITTLPLQRHRDPRGGNQAACSDSLYPKRELCFCGGDWGALWLLLRYTQPRDTAQESSAGKVGRKAKPSSVEILPSSCLPNLGTFFNNQSLVPGGKI